jgi:hypothetical protein
VRKFKIIVFLSAVLGLSACSKADKVTDLEGDSTPVFYTVLNMAGRRDSLVAGHGNYYMFTDYIFRNSTTGRNEWLIFQGNFRRVNCSKASQSNSTCDRNLLFEFFNTFAGSKPSESALAVGERLFSRPNSLDTTLPVRPLVRLQWTDSNNRIWDTECIVQPNDTYFFVDEAREYHTNELNLPTRQFRVRFNCIVGYKATATGVAVTQRCIGEGVIAIAYPRHGISESRSMTQ